MSVVEIRAIVRYEQERTVTVYIDADSDEEIGYAEVLDEVYSSGEFLDAIDLDVRDYEVVRS